MTQQINPLSALEIHALHEALEDEYRAWATYDQVIADFGDVRPFNNIRNAEARHIEALRVARSARTPGQEESLAMPACRPPVRPASRAK